MATVPRNVGMATRAVKRSRMAWLALAMATCGAVRVGAAPTGGQVVHGNVQISTVGNLTQIHATDGSIIRFQNFNIGSQETVQFIQPNASARVLNQIAGNAPTQINGSLLANGKVYLVNPAGIIFGPGSVINAGAIYAAAGNLSNSDFLAGTDHFTGLTGSVTHFGTIQAGTVMLVGQNVANHGTIVTPEGGTVALIAGSDVYILPGPTSTSQIMVQIQGPTNPAVQTSNTPGVANSGAIQAPHGRVLLGAGDMYSLAVYTSGTVRSNQITVQGGKGGVVNVAGTLDASDKAPGATGGVVKVLGDKIALTGATIDASGDAGGGSVFVGGNEHGAGPDPNATLMLVDASSTILANAVNAGNGGNVVVWSNVATSFSGLISARGGSISGNGGNVEVSSHQTLAYAGLTDLRAPAGTPGTLLLDPTDITISNKPTTTTMIQNFENTGVPIIFPGTNTQTFGPYADSFFEDPTAKSSNLNASQLVAQLLLGNVNILTASNGNGHGDITIQNPIVLPIISGLSDTMPGALGLVASRDIIINAPIMVAQLDLSAGRNITINHAGSIDTPIFVSSGGGTFKALGTITASSSVFEPQFPTVIGIVGPPLGYAILPGELGFVTFGTGGGVPILSQPIDSLIVSIYTPPVLGGNESSHDQSLPPPTAIYTSAPTPTPVSDTQDQAPQAQPPNLVTPTLADLGLNLPTNGTRIPEAPATKILAAYTAFFFEPAVDANGKPILDAHGKPRLVSRAAKIKEVFTQALAAYRADGGKFKNFETFVGSTAAQKDAQGFLKTLQSLILEIRSLPLSDVETKHALVIIVQRLFPKA